MRKSSMNKNKYIKTDILLDILNFYNDEINNKKDLLKSVIINLDFSYLD